MRVALLVIHTNSYFANLLPVAQLLRRSGWEARFLFASAYPTLARDLAVCRGEGFPCESTVVEHRPLVQAVLNRVRDNTAYVTAALVTTMRGVRKRIRDHGVDLVILPADNRYDLGAYVKAAHDEGIRVVAIPAFMAAASEWAQFVCDDPAYRVGRFSNLIAATLYPRWTLDWNDKQILALPAGAVFARETLGLAPPLPWTLHSGFTDALAIESEAMRRYCFAEGLPASQLVLTGSIDHDKMYERLSQAAALREATYATLGMAPGRPMVLTALPPDWLYGRGRPQCDFREFPALVKFWLETLTASGMNVVVSLHPSVKRETMAWIEDLGVKICDASVSTMIPLCDVYVACVSATIQWAISCGKPVINYDVYRFQYPDYLGLEGVINVEERAAYIAAMQRLTDDVARAELSEAQRRGAKFWGILDGKAGERLLGLFEQLTSRE